MVSSRINLIGMSVNEISEALRDFVDQPYRGRQVGLWIHQRDCRSFEEMTNLPLTLRNLLQERFSLAEAEVVDRDESSDGSTKYLFRLDDGAEIEGVAMRSGTKATFCLSSQTGCALGCRFCVTGALGAGRNLRPEEILAQYRRMRREVPQEIERVNIVFMGMGEPLLNTEYLGRALEALYERVSPKRITVSTAGIIPGLLWLAALKRRPKLAISLNAPTQELREELMPISHTHPLEDLMSVLRDFPLEGGRRITFEYVLIRGVNDSPAHARQLRRLLHGIPSKLNIIPLNEDPKHLPGLYRPSEEVTEDFACSLREAGQVVTLRRSKGSDVSAACGQLKGRGALTQEP